MTLEQNITAILETYFCGFRSELIEACAKRIMEQIERQADTPQTESTGSPIGDYRDGVGAWQTDCEDIYPLVIIKDRYTGVYSNGKYTAWNMYFDEIPQDIEEDDVSCRNFWYSYDGTVGLGETPNEAIEDLRKKLNTERNEE